MIMNELVFYPCPNCDGLIIGFIVRDKVRNLLHFITLADFKQFLDKGLEYYANEVESKKQG